MNGSPVLNVENILSCVEDVRKNLRDAEYNINRLSERLNCCKGCCQIEYAETVVEDDAETVVEDDAETVIDYDAETMVDDDAETLVDHEPVTVSDNTFQPIENYVVVFQKLYSCNLCQFKTKYKKSHKDHMLRHSDSRPFKCDHVDCDKSYKTKQDLKQHKYKHIGKKLDCDKCDKKFTYPSELCSHKKKHHPQ